MKRALILGIGGMDGSYLADILLEKGYEVHGVVRHSSVNNLQRIEHCKDRLILHRGDMADSMSIEWTLEDVKPDEIYNEADQDNVGWSEDTAGYSADITYGAVARTLKSVLGVCPKAKFFQPCSATMFGHNPGPQNEDTPFDPQSPYAVAKTAAYYACRYYRKTFGMFVSTGIMFNHDSPRRGPDYLLQLICRSAIRIAKGEQETLALGNHDLKVDIGYAREYMEAAHAMLQLDKPDDFVIGTGTTYAVKNLARIALGIVCPHWRSKAVDERILFDLQFTRSDQSELLANTEKATLNLDFHPKVWGGRLLRMIIEELQKCE